MVGRAGRSSVPRMEARTLHPRTAWERIRHHRAQLVDLRDHAEIDLLRVGDARQIPFDELAAEIVTLDHERPVVLLSGAGTKATQAVDVLQAAGLHAWAVDGGMRGWLAAGLPVERRPDISRAPAAPESP